MTTASGHGDKKKRPDENTRPRQIRISDGLWAEAKKKAEREDMTVADAVRAFLVTWTGYDGPAVHGRDYSKSDT